MLRSVTVRLGSDELLDSGALCGQRVGIVCNPASIDAQFRHVVDRIATATGVTLAAIFGPQHGVRADLQDNMIESPHAEDARRRVPVYSLYSETREPTAAMLHGLDVLVIDLQDVGTRVYTFAHTMANCLRAGRRHGVRVIVCDRPNPIGGEAIEGPILKPEYASFVGQFAIPLRHGLTMGEMARLFNEEFGIGAELDVVPMRDWRRAMYWDETGLPWVLPSPNMPTVETAFVYPGQCLLEGTNLSEGRGTTRPFELCGAPWIDAVALAGRLRAQGLPGVAFRPAWFRPTFHKFASQDCGGVQLHVTDRQVFQPVRTGLAVLAALRELSGERFAWRTEPYEFVTDRPAIDLLFGSPRERQALEAGRPADEMARAWEVEAEDFRRRRQVSLLYG